MKKLLLVLVLAAAVATACPSIDDASAHKSYTGHSCVYWHVTTPNGPIYWRECYIFGEGVSPHTHSYRTSWLSGSDWKTYHYHYGRLAPNTHPV